MTNEAKPKRRRKWLIIAGSLLLLLIVGWFVLTSGPFIKSFILPRVASALHADLAVDSLSLSPFSRVEINNVKLAPVGGKPLVEANKILLEYHLLKMLGGNIAVDRVELDQPRITLRQRADGGSDLTDWLNQLSSGGSKSKAPPAGPSKPLQVAVGTIAFKDGSLQIESTHKDGSVDHLSVSSLDVSIDGVKNGANAAAKFGAVVKMEQANSKGTVSDALAVKLGLDGKISLGADLMPTHEDVKFSADITEATGRFANGSGLGADLTVRGSTTKIDDLSLAFQQQGKPAGAVWAMGAYDPAAGSGAFDVNVTNLPPMLLTLAASSAGATFDLAGFASTNHIAIKDKGRTISATGGLKVDGLAAHKGGRSTPTLNLALNFATEAQPAASQALISVLSFSATQDGRPLLDARVNRPFHFGWKGAPSMDGGTQLDMVLTNLDLSAWRPLTGAQPLAGVASLSLGVTGADSGKQINVQMTTALDRAGLSLGTNQVDQLAATVNLGASLRSMTDLQISQFEARLTHAGRSVVDFSTTGGGALSSPKIDLQTQLKVDLPSVAGLMGKPPIGIRQGTLSYQGSVAYSTNHTGTTGTLKVDDFSADMAGASLDQVALNAPVQFDINGPALQWKIDPLRVSVNGKPALEFNTSGQLQRLAMTGKLQLAVPLINEQLVNPFLAVYSPQQSLRSARAAITVNGDLQDGGLQSWSLESRSTNIVLIATNGIQVVPPLATHAELAVDFNATKKALTIKRWEGTLFSNGNSSGHFSSSGNIRLGDGQASLNLQLTGINENSLRPLAPLLLGNRQIEKAQIEAAVNVDYTSTKPSHVRASLGVKNLEISDPSGRFPQAPESMEASFDASIASNRLDIADSHVQLTPTALATNRVLLTGWLDFSHPSALKGDLRVNSPGMDVTPFYTMWSKTAGTNASPAQPTTAKPASEKPASAGTSLPVDRLDLALDIRHFHLGELAITNWVAQTTVRSNSVDLGNFSLRLNDAPVNARMTATNDAAGLSYQLATEIEALPIEPFVHTFKPELNNRVQGTVFAAVHLHGNVPPGANLVPASTGEIYFGLTNANYEPFSKRWQTALKPVGLLLQTPELFSSPIKWAYEHSTLTDHVLNLANLTIISDSYVMDITNTIPLKIDLVSSDIPRMPVDLYLSRNLVTQLGFLKGANSNQAARFVELPTFIHVSGTIGDPKVETDKLKLTGMTLGKAADFVGGSAGDILRKAGGATEGLGGLLSGNKSSDSGASGGNTASRGLGGVFNAVGGLLGGTGKAVEKGTSVVSGTKTIEKDVLTSRMAAFDWQRVFTNAPNMLPAQR